MLRPLDIFFIALTVAAVTGTYMVKYGSEIENGEISRLEHQIQQQKDAIDVLNADWALLTSPARMQKLVERYGDELMLEGVGVQKIVSINDIPMRPPTIPSANRVKVTKFRAVEGEVSNETTAAINKSGDQ